MAGLGLQSVGDEKLAELILSARRRPAVLAPALTPVLCKAIARQWGRLGVDGVSVVVDVDPLVYRNGLGDFRALQELDATARSLGTMVHRQPGLRLGLIVFDGRVELTRFRGQLTFGVGGCHDAEEARTTRAVPA
jgi:hypothetical protein